MGGTQNADPSWRDGSGARNRRQFTPQLSSESEGEPPPPGSDILTRYLLDSIGRSESSKINRSKETEDSLNSSDSEYNTEEDRRRNKVNLRQLEERLNMIQEEGHWSGDSESDDDHESDDERSATIDERSERNEPMDILDDSEIIDCKNNNGELPTDDDLDLIDNDENTQEFESVFSKIDQFLDNSKLIKRRNSGRSRSEGWSFSDCEDRGRDTSHDRGRETNDRPASRSRDHSRPMRGQDDGLRNARSGMVSVRGRPRSAPPRTNRKLNRAHSCGSLLSNRINGKLPGTAIWDLLSSSESSSPLTIVTTNDIASVTNQDLTLTLSSVAPPLSLIRLQAGQSRCCNLC